MNRVIKYSACIGAFLLLFALFLVYYLRGSWNPLREEKKTLRS